MIIIEVMGGLGNQLQQYALYQKMKSLGKDVKLDLSWFSEEVQKKMAAPRKLELTRFVDLPMEVCTEAEKARLVGSDSLWGKLKRRLPGQNRYFRESEMYHPEIFRFDDMYLSGYWACEKYYADILPMLREAISFPERWGENSRRQGDEYRIKSQKNIGKDIYKLKIKEQNEEYNSKNRNRTKNSKYLKNGYFTNNTEKHESILKTNNYDNINNSENKENRKNIFNSENKNNIKNICNVKNIYNTNNNIYIEEKLQKNKNNNENRKTIQDTEYKKTDKSEEENENQSKGTIREPDFKNLSSYYLNAALGEESAKNATELPEEKSAQEHLDSIFTDLLNEMIREEMAEKESVSIHLRRGDYLDPDNAALFGGICTDAYYEAAVRYILERYPDAHFYVFSDDSGYAREFCKQHSFRREERKVHQEDGQGGGRKPAPEGAEDRERALFSERCIVVDWNTGENSFLDIRLMNCCRHNICANSTFSFWGARLNPDPDKIKIRPLKHKNSQTARPEEMKELWAGWVLIDEEGRVIS